MEQGGWVERLVQEQIRAGELRVIENIVAGLTRGPTLPRSPAGRDGDDLGLGDCWRSSMIISMPSLPGMKRSVMSRSAP